MKMGIRLPIGLARGMAWGLALGLAASSTPALARADRSKKAAAATKQLSAEEQEKRAAAKRFFDAGTLLYDRGDFIEAAREFERAYAEAPLGDFLYNIATAYDKGGDRKKAAEAYRKFAELMPEAKETTAARKRAEVLEKEWRELEEVEAQKRKAAEEAQKAAEKAKAARAKLPPSLPFVEPVTRFTYQTLKEIDGKAYTLLGAGARKVMGFKVYAMGLYVEDEPARAAFPSLAARAGGSDHATLLRNDLVNQWLVLGDFGKMAHLHFVRNVSAKDTRDSYRDAMPDAFSSTAPADLRRDAEAFLAMFDDIKDGDDLVIRTTADGQVIVEQNGKVKRGPKNQRLVHDIWDIWMGQKPINADLKKTLVDRVDTLGR
jgi:tetratricopeptide (TPR) repeat protein